MSKPVGPNKVAAAKFFTPSERVSPAVQAVDGTIASVSSASHANPSMRIDRIAARLAINTASIAMFTHLATTHVTGVT